VLEDQYGNQLSTSSQRARDAYVEAVDLFLAADGGIEEAFQKAIDADENFAPNSTNVRKNFTGCRTSCKSPRAG